MASHTPHTYYTPLKKRTLQYVSLVEQRRMLPDSEFRWAPFPSTFEISSRRVLIRTRDYRQPEMFYKQEHAYRSSTQSITETAYTRCMRFP